MKSKASAARPRVLVIFGNIPLLGHERGNIQVFNALKERGVEALFVTHKEYGHEVIQPALDRLGHRWTWRPTRACSRAGWTSGRGLRDCDLPPRAWSSSGASDENSSRPMCIPDMQCTFL